MAPPLIRRLSSFEGLYCSGTFVPRPATVTALALLFERIRLPNELGGVIQLSRGRTIRRPDGPWQTDVAFDDHGDAIMKALPAKQRQNVEHYLDWTVLFLQQYRELLGSVIVTDMLKDQTHPIETSVVATEMVAHDTAKVTVQQKIELEVNLHDKLGENFRSHIRNGSVPVFDQHYLSHQLRVERQAPLAMASILAIRAVEMCLPLTVRAEPAVILEARDRLRDHLPPFWSAMLKLTVELEARLTEPNIDIDAEAARLVDLLVRPALIDLTAKIAKERRNWFFRILASSARSLRVLVGAPPMTPATAVGSALLVASDVSIDVAFQMKRIEALKEEGGLAFLLELDGAVASGRK